MSVIHGQIQRTNYFAGGARKREELLAEPACPPCGSCDCGECAEYECAQCSCPNCWPIVTNFVSDHAASVVAYGAAIAAAEMASAASYAAHGVANVADFGVKSAYNIAMDELEAVPGI